MLHNMLQDVTKLFYITWLDFFLNNTLYNQKHYITCRWNATHIPLCMWCFLFTPSLSFSMKQLIWAIVLHLHSFAEADICKRTLYKRTPQQIQLASLECLAAPKTCVKGAQAGWALKSASDQASVNKCVWQKMNISFHWPVRSLLVRVVKTEIKI